MTENMAVFLGDGSHWLDNHQDDMSTTWGKLLAIVKKLGAEFNQPQFAMMNM